jgi:DNA repair exonuclease SbcCD ATPase subunit
MRSSKVHYLRARDILCFGPEGVEIHFSDHGNVIQVKGINMDYPYSADDPHASSNAAGKSSLQELLSIGFYGRTVKSPTKNKGAQIINCLSNKGEIEIQWDDYRLIRAFRRSKTGTINCKIDIWKSADKIWDDKSYITQPHPDAQTVIDQAIGLSHNAFCNVVIFDDSNTYSFLEADTPKKREIVENLLDLEQYREYHENAKDIVKDIKKKIDTTSKEYCKLQDEVEAVGKRIIGIKQQEIQWKTHRQEQISDLSKRISQKQQDLLKTDTGSQLLNWEKAQRRVAELTEENTSIEQKRTKLEEAIKAARDKVQVIRDSKDDISQVLQQHRLAMQEAESKLQQNLKLISKLEGMNDGATCPYCYGTINRENYGPALLNARHSADECRERAGVSEQAAEAERGNFEKKGLTILSMENKIREAEGKVAVLEAKVRKNRQDITQLSSLPKPEGNVAEQVLEVEIVELKKQLKTRQEELEGDSPYIEIVRQAEAEKSNKEAEKDTKVAELQALEEELPYYQFWVEAFGDNGIRKFVIDSIIPSLNERVAYWLQILIEGKLELVFDNKLDATLTRNGNPASYFMASNGEKRRINLAVSQAFAYVMMLNSGSCPSLVFLDEITGGGIDRAGVSGIYNMIFELAKERQVFVTTHNENLMSLMHGCETITLKKHNDITVLAL